MFLKISERGNCSLVPPGCGPSQKGETSKVGGVITSPGAWTTSGSLSREFSQQKVARQYFLGHSGHVTEPLHLRFLYSE